jgi:hypothetical protein
MFSSTDSIGHLVVVGGAKRRPVGNVRCGPIELLAKNRPRSTLTAIFPDLRRRCCPRHRQRRPPDPPARPWPAILERNGSTPGRSSECLDLDLAQRAGDVVGTRSPVAAAGRCRDPAAAAAPAGSSELFMALQIAFGKDHYHNRKRPKKVPTADRLPMWSAATMSLDAQPRVSEWCS